MQLRQQSQKWHHDQKDKREKVQRGDNVSVHNFSGNAEIPGVIEKLRGLSSCHIDYTRWSHCLTTY